jgi:hypothetical protein
MTVDMLRITFVGAVSLAISTAFVALDWASAAQLTKGDRIVVQDREVKNYERPRQNGNRLAFCTAAGQCGKPAADEFCRSNDFEGALTFQRDRMEGHSAKLRFFRIKCWRSTHAGTAEKSHASQEPAKQLISNTAAKSNRR